jgi:plasmid stabilization system protein ParE
MKVRYTKRAFADREKIFDYLDERNPQAARAVVGLIH